MKIFICYRREDSEETAGRIYDRLAETFGRDAIFKDVDTIPSPVKFADFIVDWLRKSNVVLVLIGREWLTVHDGKGHPRRLDPEDFVRIEISTALSLAVPLIPVSVRWSTLPNADALPDCLRDLTKWNGLSVRPDPDFHRDLDRLIDRIREITGASEDWHVIDLRLVANHEDRIRFGLANESDYPIHISHVRLCFASGESLTANPDEIEEDSWGRVLLPAHTSSFWAVRATQLEAMYGLLTKPSRNPLSLPIYRFPFC